MRLSGNRGLALVAVLWITMLLAVIAASFASSGRTESRLARNLIENAKAEALADGAVHRAVMGLLASDLERIWQADGRPYVLGYGEGEVRVTISDEDAKVDLNGAPPELLTGLLHAIGLEQEDAELLADRIVDYRDPDDEVRPLGAEDPDYLTAGRERGAKDGPFVSTEELRQVLGMPEALVEQLQPLVTVYSGAEGLDPSRAGISLLQAIPGITDDVIDALDALEPGDDPFDLPGIDEDLLFELELYFVPSREIMYTVRAEAQGAGGGVFVREAVVELTADPSQPFDVHDWRRGDLQ